MLVLPEVEVPVVTATPYAATPVLALPDEVVEQAKHHLLDSLASMISGSALPAGDPTKGAL